MRVRALLAALAIETSFSRDLAALFLAGIDWLLGAAVRSMVGG